MEYLAVTAISSDQTVFFNELLKQIAKHECNIAESRMLRLGCEFGCALLISGNWSSIAKLESALLALNQTDELNIQVKRTEAFSSEEALLPYLVQVIALDSPGLTYDITSFFIKQSIYINDLQINPFTSFYTNTQMVLMLISISIPADTNLSDLREQFMLLCDDLNIDGILEPEKR